MAFSVGDAFLTVRPDATGFEGALTGEVTEALGNVQQLATELGTQLTQKLTLPIAIGMATNITQFQALEARLRETTTLFSAVGDRAERFVEDFRTGISSVSDEVGVFERQISDGLYDAISAGVPKDNVFSFMETASKASVGGALEIQSAVNGLTTAVNAFYGADFNKASEAADILFRGVARGKTTFDELSQSMAQAAPLANTAGVSFEEFIAVLATMTLSGTETSVAVTNVRAAMTGLLRPMPELTAIFQEAGFATQDLAVKSLGLQGASQVVAEAVDYEVGALISLLGGAEAANAVLQITGENADTFASVMRDTSSATGSLDAAFRQMDEGVGRSFGRLTAAADRFGSTMGEIASVVAQPLADGLTFGITKVNSFVDAIADGPVAIQAMITSALLFTAALGPLLLLVSRIGPLFGITFARTALQGKNFFQILNIGARTAAGGIGFMITKVTSYVPALDKFTGATRAASLKALDPLTSSLGKSALKFVGWGAAIAAVVVAAELFSNHIKRIKDESQFATTQVEKLADSLGLVVKPAEELAKIGETTITFKLENAAVIQSLKESVDSGLLEDRLIQIGYQLVTLGNTPEQAFEAIQQLATAANIKIPVELDVEDLNISNFKGSIAAEFSNFADIIRPELLRTENTLASFLFDPFSKQIQQQIGLTEQFGDQLATVFTNASPKEAIDLFKEFEEQLGADTQAIDFMGEAFLRALDPADNLKFSMIGYQNVNDILEQMRERFISITGPIDQVSLSADRILTRTQQLANVPEFGLTPEEFEVVDGAMSSLNSTIESVQQSIAGRLTEIQTGLVNTIPFFGEFAGAAELSATATTEAFDTTELIASLDAYNEAIVGWAETSASLAGEIPEGLRTKLDEMPLEQRAALTNLANESPKEFQKVIDAYEESFNLALDVGEDKWKDELPSLIAEGNVLIANKAAELEDEFGDIGQNVADAWEERFRKASNSWATVVGSAARSATSAANRVLGVESPSRVFASIGENTALGFIQGFSRKEPAISKAVADALTLSPMGSLPIGASAGGGGGTSGGRGDRGGDKNISLVVHNPTTKDLRSELERFKAVAETTMIMSGG